MAGVAAGAEEAPDARGTPPVALERVPPRYPVTARRQDVSGRVVAHAHVDAEGKVTRVSIRKSPHELLSEAVEEALVQWKFQPSMKDGKAVGTVVEYEFVFNLKEPGEPLEGARPAPSMEVVARYIAAIDGAEEYRTRYWRAEGHKAFASADDGSWSWAGARSSVEQATQAAQHECDGMRTPMTRTCRVVDIDGKLQEGALRAPLPWRELSPFETSSYRRDVVDTWSEARKARASAFLDQCRVEADRFVPIWKSQDVDAIYAALAGELREQYTREQFGEAVATMKSTFGLMASATFLDQELVTRRGDDDLRLDLHSVVRYTLTTTTWKTPGLYLLISLTRESGICRVTSLQYFYPPGVQPPEPQRGT